MNSPPTPNTLGKASLILGVLGSFFVVLIGLCAGVGQQQGWLKAVGPLLAIFGGAFAFLGLVAVLLGVLGIFHRARGTAIAGLLLGLVTVLLFAAIVSQANK
jgi:nicotinamide riboside transporter PnuC